jgi:RHS repeat-associated protein
MVGIGEKLVRRERPPAVAPLWWEHFAYLSQQKNPVAKISSPDPRLYFTQDANWDTTAVVGYNSTSGTWGVVQRYVYSPYGTITVLNADWSTPPAGTQPLVNNLYQGMTLDAVTGRYYERNRDYSPSLGRWMEQDPAQYINGANTYQFVNSSPTGNVDAAGLRSVSLGPDGSLTVTWAPTGIAGGGGELVYPWYGLTPYWQGGAGLDIGSLPPWGLSTPETWQDANSVTMLQHFELGGGVPIRIVGRSFLAAVEGSSQLKQEESQYEAQLLEKVRAAAARLGPGQDTTVKFEVKDFSYTMPGSWLNPGSRFYGFGSIHVNIIGSAVVSKGECGSVSYHGTIQFDGYDRYQWGTLENARGHWYDFAPDAFGWVLSKVGTPFNSYWNWTEPFSGDLP